MKAPKYLCILLSGWLAWFGLISSTVEAQFSSDWTVDEHAYEYDMSAFIALQQDQTPLNRWTEMQVAAFCATECRGIATVQQIDTTGLFYYYLRVRSNTQYGDTIYFKCFDNVAGTEFVIPGVVVFEHLSQLGNPSSPYKLTFPPIVGLSKQDVAAIQLIYQNQQLQLKGLEVFDLIQVLSLDGAIHKRVVSDETAENIVLSDLPKGFYLVRIIRNHTIRCFKIVR